MMTRALQLLVLEVLRDAGDLLTPEPALLREVNSQSPTPVTRSDLDATLKALDSVLQVIGIGTDDGTKWKCSARGAARLAEAER